MVSIGHDGATQDEWDLVWQDYDRRNPRPAAVHAAQPRVQRRRRGAGLMLAMAMGLSLAPNEAAVLTDGMGRPAGGDALARLLSLAPEEAELPPLAAAVSRLAAESATAACWVMRLDPRSTGCGASR